MSERKIENVSTVDLPMTDLGREIVAKDIEKNAPIVKGMEEEVLRVENLKMYFPVTQGLLARKVGEVKAVDDVTFTIQKGKTLGIVGESGSGKSTLGNCVMRNLNVTGGNIVFNGKDITKMKGKELAHLHRKLQMITQNPFESLDPRMKVKDSILEGPQIQKMHMSPEEEDDLVRRMMELVGLNPKFADRFPHEFSGGQRQRISIARGLALNPSFLICDEIVSALDVSIQAQIVGLMMKLQRDLGLTYIFIGHDLSVVRHISDQVAVMYLGKFMEMTSAAELYDHPLHPYTKALISAAPIPDPIADRKRERILLHGEIPSPMHPPKGCNFCTRCAYADERCRNEEPKMRNVGGDHFVACHKV